MTPGTGHGNGGDPQPRHIRPAEVQTAAEYPTVHQRWAVIVGISKYRREPRWNLQYADRDARELAKLIKTPSGGGFEPDHVLELINGNATTAKVNRALRAFLQKPAPEDVVLIYFACHGVQDPNRPGNLYLLTHDANPNDIPGSALPMREIDASLQDNLLAERVIIVADTCHSAAIGAGARGGVNDAEAINRYLQQVGKAKGGTALLTSAEASESSYEDQKWGGGHGVFTHFLLEGMRGNADSDKDGVVSVGELFEYVRDQVKLATGNRQHPSIGTTQFDRRMPVSVPGGDLAAAHLDLAEELYALSWRLDDRRFVRSAQRHLGEADRVAPQYGPENARLEKLRGLAYEALDDNLPATKAFAKALKQHGAGADSLYHLGIAEAKLGNAADAAAALEKYLATTPQSDTAGWIANYVSWLQNVPKSTRRALLIGINEYANIHGLRGSVTDVELIRDILVGRFDFAPENVRTLTDSAATRKAIVDELQSLKDCAAPGDSVVVHFSGHSLSGDSEAYLLACDSSTSGEWSDGDVSGAINAAELHEWITAIPTKHKTLILDTHPNDKFLALARSHSFYTLMMAAASDMTYEKTFERNGSQVTTGAFTYALVEQLSVADPRLVTYADIEHPLVRTVRAEFPRQTPCFVGIRARRLFGDADEFLEAIEFSRKRSYRDLTADDIHQRYLRCRETITAPFPELHASFGRAFLTHADYGAATSPLSIAVEQYEGLAPATTLALGVAQACAEDYRQALKSLEAFRHETSTSIHGEALEDLERQVRAADRSRKRALLVGISHYAHVPHTRAADDVAALKEALCNKFGFDDEDVTVLIDQQATADAIRASFTQLAEAARDDVAVFYFAGNGSTGRGGVPTIVSYDGRHGMVYDIELAELSAQAGADTRLISIVDAGWAAPAEERTPWRYVEPDERSRPLARGVAQWAQHRLLALRSAIGETGPQIGRLSLYAGSISGTAGDADGEFTTEDTLGSTGSPSNLVPRGRLSFALAKVLWAAAPGKDTYTDLVREVGSTLSELAGSPTPPVVLGVPLDVPLFGRLPDPAGVVRSWTKMEHSVFDRLIGLLQRAIERRNGVYPECHVDLGIAYALTEQYEKSVAALETAIRQRDDDPDAHYWLGRALYDSRGDLVGAVSQLQEATTLEPDNARAKYYLGQAIRLLVEREMLSEAADALSSYLDAGAPLGDQEAVQAFVLEHMTPNP